MIDKEDFIFLIGFLLIEVEGILSENATGMVVVFVMNMNINGETAIRNKCHIIIQYIYQY